MITFEIAFFAIGLGVSFYFESLALRTALQFEKKNAEAAAMLTAKGVKLYDWSTEDRLKFRKAAQSAWADFASTPEAKALVDSHLTYLRQLGLAQ